MINKLRLLAKKRKILYNLFITFVGENYEI